MSNDLPGLRGVVAFIAAQPRRVWVSCEPDDEGAMRLVHLPPTLGEVGAFVEPPEVADDGSVTPALVVTQGETGLRLDRRLEISCESIRTVYVAGVPTPAHDLCDAAARLTAVLGEIPGVSGRAQTYVRPGTAYGLHHNKRLYLRPGSAQVTANPLYRNGVVDFDGKVLRVEMELLEPEGLSPFEAFVFAERMMQLWGERMAARRDAYENPPPAPKQRKKLTPTQLASRRERARARAVERGYLDGCLRERHRANHACSGGCVNAASRPDLSLDETLFAIAEGMHALPVDEIRRARAARTNGRTAPYAECQTCTARQAVGAVTCLYCGGRALRYVGTFGIPNGGGGSGGGISVAARHISGTVIVACAACRDTGVIETGNNDHPCDCSAGDRAMFNVAGQGPLTGAQIKRERATGLGYLPVDEDR